MCKKEKYFYTNFLLCAYMRQVMWSEAAVSISRKILGYLFLAIGCPRCPLNRLIEEPVVTFHSLVLLPLLPRD